MNYRKIAVFSVVALLLVACDKKEILPGKREAISGVTENIGTGRSVVNSSAHIIPSPAESIVEYVDIAGNKRHCSVNHRMPTSSKILWKTSIGGWSVGSDPIAFDGKVYVVNSYGNLVCVSQNNGEKLWELPVAPQTDDSDFSGGLTASGNTLYVSANTGDVIAVDTVSQKELWRKSLKYPLRGTPLIVGNRLFVNSIENQTFALDAVNGRVIWQKSTSAENTIMAASGSPALFGDDVICAYSSGDVKSLQASNGSCNWEETLFSSHSSESGSAITHIAASPVVFGENVLVATSEAKTALFDVASGFRIWETDIGTIHTPVINSSWIFVLSSNGSVICLSASDGSTKWSVNISDLKQEKFRDDTRWCDPLLINGDIVLFNNYGDVAKLDISTGRVKSLEQMDEGFAKTPIIVNGRMFAISDRADIYAVG